MVVERFPAEMIVYAHLDRGRLTYLSGRSIADKRHHNPPKDLIGERQPYFNHVYRYNAEEVVVVEGQADAVSFAAWELPAVALAGMKASDGLLERLKKHRRVFILLDNTSEAQDKALALARAVGLHACLPELPETVKDAGEWLVREHPAPEQVTGRLNAAPDLVEKEVSLIQRLQGLKRGDAVETLITQAAGWDKAQISRLRDLMKSRLKISSTFFNDLLKASQELQQQTTINSGEPAAQILGDDIPLVSPALGFLPEMAVVTVAILERTPENYLQLQPYLVTSQRELLRLSREQIIRVNGQEVALRVIPEGSEFLRRWRYSDIQRFLAGEAVSPGEAFQAVHDLFTRYVDFASPMDSQIVTLWVIGTYFYTMFVAYPYLALNGPKNSGKSTVLNVAKPLAFNMLATSDVTGPSLFRLIHQNSCTVGIDEAERYYNPRDPEMQQIRQLLNSGYKPGMPAIRLMGDEMRPQAFDVYSPKILANIAGLEDILARTSTR